MRAAIGDGGDCVGGTLRTVHRLKKEMVEREAGVALRFGAGLRKDELQLVALREHEFGARFRTDADPVKAARRRLRIVELPVAYRPRLAGRSKVSGTLDGTVLTTYRIFRVLMRYAF